MGSSKVCKPESWYWLYDTLSKRLGVVCLTTDNQWHRGNTVMSGATIERSLVEKHIVTKEKGIEYVKFTEEDAQLYKEVYDRITDLNFDSAQRFMTAINAACIARFHRELPCQDSFFKKLYNGNRKNIDIGEILIAATSVLNQQGNYSELDVIVVEKNDEDQTFYGMVMNTATVKVNDTVSYKCGQYLKLRYSQVLRMSDLTTPRMVKTLNIA
ncbi:MAG: hypothetical protein ACI4V7_02775 [Succinivibrionaceae bacterium]